MKNKEQIEKEKELLEFKYKTALNLREHQRAKRFYFQWRKLKEAKENEK